MTALQTCTGCSRELPVTREFFGNTPSGGFRRKCRECMAAHTRAHDLNNPDNVRSRVERRKSRDEAAGPRYSDLDIAYLLMAQDDRCAYCTVALDGAGHVDHMTPLAKGGTNARDNLVLACFQCNTEKHAKTAHEYFWWRSRRGLPVYGHAYAYLLLYGGS
jgi:5-methylcytosine-specific restriction endonuclease McrA